MRAVVVGGDWAFTYSKVSAKRSRPNESSKSLGNSHVTQSSRFRRSLWVVGTFGTTHPGCSFAQIAMHRTLSARTFCSQVSLHYHVARTPGRDSAILTHHLSHLPPFSMAGTGCFVASVATSVDRQPVNCGKPEAVLMEIGSSARGCHLWIPALMLCRPPG